jgi:quinol monooxygenase YgiN
MRVEFPVSAFHQDITSGSPIIHSVAIPFLNQRTYIYGVQIDRRTFLEQLGAVALTPVLTGSQEASSMWGLIAKITLLPGKRDEIIEILKESAADMPGCLSYVMAKDISDENTIWVTEVWDSVSSHDASLSLPSVKNAIPRGKHSFRTSRRSPSRTRSGEQVCQRLRPTNLPTSDGELGSNSACLVSYAYRKCSFQCPHGR